MAFPNGMIPLDQMTRLSVGGGYLLPAAAQNFESWRAEARKAGWNLSITSAADAFRTYQIQERIFRERYTTTYLSGRPTKRWNGVTWWLKPGQATAAVPGTSNHGKGLAVDINNAGPFDVGFHKWMSSTGPKHGWSNAEGRSIKEPWHWVNDNIARGAIGSVVDEIPEQVVPPTQEQDEDMDVTQATQLAEVHWMLGQIRGTDLSSIKQQTDRLPAIHASVDLANAGIGNVTNGVKGVLDRLGVPVDIDEAALAASLAPLLSFAAPTLTDADLTRVANAVADEQSKRLSGK